VIRDGLVVLLLLLSACTTGRSPVRVLRFWNSEQICIDGDAKVEVQAGEGVGASRLPAWFMLRLDELELRLQPGDHPEKAVEGDAIAEFVRSHPESIRVLESGQLIWINARLAAREVAGDDSEEPFEVAPGNGVRSLIVANGNPLHSESKETIDPDPLVFLAVCERSMSGAVSCHRQFGRHGTVWSYEFSPETESVLEADQKAQLLADHLARSCQAPCT
jgi:hypothetical protein